MKGGAVQRGAEAESNRNSVDRRSGDSGERVKSNQIVVQAKTDADFGGSVIQAVNEGVGTIRQRTEQIAHQYNVRKGSDTLG